MNIDLNNHPLTGFFRQICKEYERGLKKHGAWENIPRREQLFAIQGEMLEWQIACVKKDVDGEHGELAELTHLANVAGKRWEYLTAHRKEASP